MFDVWNQVKGPDGKPVWNGHDDVWRKEVRFRRPALDEFKWNEVDKDTGEIHEYEGIDTVEQVDLAAMVEYEMDWISLRVPNKKRNKSRDWKVSPIWVAIKEGAIARIGKSGKVLARGKMVQAQIDRLIAQQFGCMKSIAVLMKEDHIVRLFDTVRKESVDLLLRKDLDWHGELKRRRTRFMSQAA